MLRVAVLPAVFLSGCAMNSVRPLSPDSVAKSKQAVLVYGVQVEGKWDYPLFNVEVAEYDLKAQAVAGNCFVFNRADATVPATPGAVRYFAFEVPVGHYTYGPFNAVSIVGKRLAFRADAGRLTYIGDFIYTPAKTVELRRNSEGYEASLVEVFPGTSGKFVLAESFSVQSPQMFLCTP